MRSSGKIVTIPVEAKVRELDEKVTLAAWLTNRGHRVVLGPDTSVDTYAEERGSDVHFVNGAVASPVRSRVFPALAARGTSVLLLDTEGANQADSPTLRARFDPPLLPHIRRYLAWGEVPAGVTVAATGFPRERTVVTGLPRFDLLRAPYSAVHDAARARIRNVYGRFLLVNTNHTRANPFRPGVVRVLAHDIARVEHQRGMMKAYEEALPKIAERFPDLTIVVRPHPGESIETYRRMFARYPRIRACHEGSVQPWILESVAVVHNHCLTGVEAAVGGTPVVAFNATGWEQKDFTIANAVSAHAATVNDLLAFVGACVDGAAPGSARLDDSKRALLRGIVSNVDDPAIPKIVDIVDGLLEAGPTRPATPPLRRRLRRLALRVLGTRGVDLLRDVKHFRHPDRLHYSRHKMEGIFLHEVRDRVDALARAGRLAPIRVRPVPGFEHTYELYTA